MKDCPCRLELLERINEVSFAVDEAKLFLDTHPCDEEALEYFIVNSRMRKELLQEYAEKYSPLTMDTVLHCESDTWSWINEPWPWQEGGC